MRRCLQAHDTISFKEVGLWDEQSAFDWVIKLVVHLNYGRDFFQKLYENLTMELMNILSVYVYSCIIKEA